MMSCCGSSAEIVSHGLSKDDFGVLITLFMTGFLGSFTHCIGMCGPVAIGQMSMRLMNLPADKISQRSKLLCALSIPYYVGKTFTYVTLTVASYFFASLLAINAILKIIGITLMLIAGLFFLGSAFNQLKILPLRKALFKQNKPDSAMFLPHFSLRNIIPSQLSRWVSSLTINPFGFNGWLLGIVLGLIPCGLLYAAMTTAVANSSSALVAGASIFLFGLGTIPGLFVIAYVGEKLLMKWRKLSRILYGLSMLFNAYLLLSAAIRMASILK